MNVPFPSGLREVKAVAELNIHGVRCFAYIKDGRYVLSDYVTGRWLGESVSIAAATRRAYVKIREVAKKLNVEPREALHKQVAEWVAKDGVVNAPAVVQ